MIVGSGSLPLVAAREGDKRRGSDGWNLSLSLSYCHHHHHRRRLVIIISAVASQTRQGDTHTRSLISPSGADCPSPSCVSPDSPSRQPERQGRARSARFAWMGVRFSSPGLRRVYECLTIAVRIRDPRVTFAIRVCKLVSACVSEGGRMAGGC